jgi:D-beta-D-heptose 7-phosphate kinase/D-beta-D-heptose 1-phosphate adenosyltransferase
MQLPADVVEKLGAWRAEGKRIVFTNGVFDLMHPGHLAQLKAARALGDVLVVGLNSDASVRKLAKGEDRPLMPEQARKQLLEELRCVDAVVVFNDDTPLALIEVVQPDVLVKGADYAHKVIVGRKVVEAGGGRVELVPLLPGWSTTELLRRIRGE